MTQRKLAARMGLPVDCPPLPGEALPGYLQRLAEAVRLTPGEVCSFLGLRSQGRTVPYLHLALPDAEVDRVAQEVGVAAQSITAMLVASFSGLDLEALERRAPAAHRSAQRAQWLFLSGTRLCAECLREQRPWANGWQLPWTYACLRHGLLLLDGCPNCGRRPDLVARGGYGTAHASLRQCSCGRPWTTLDAPYVSAYAEDLQRRLLFAARGGTRDLWGNPSSGFDRLAAWRAAASLVCGVGDTPVWAARPYLVPPREAAAMAAAITRVAPVVEAPTREDAAVELGSIMSHRGGYGEAAVWDHVPKSSPLAPVAKLWLRQSGRVHARLSRIQREALNLVCVDMKAIPTLAPVEWLPARWMTVSRPDGVMCRALLSLAIARLAGAGTWADAGEQLGIDGAYAARLSGYTLRALGEAAVDELTAAATSAASLLAVRAQLAERPSGGRLRGAAALRRFGGLAARR